jgi:hypothetical protein
VINTVVSLLYITEIRCRINTAFVFLKRNQGTAATGGQRKQNAHGSEFRISLPKGPNSQFNTVNCPLFTKQRRLRSHYIEFLYCAAYVIEGKIQGQKEVTRRRGRRRKQLVDDLGDRRGYSHLKEEALDRIKWRNRFGKVCGPVV